MPRIRLNTPPSDRIDFKLTDEERAICFRIARSRDGVLYRWMTKGMPDLFGIPAPNSNERRAACEALVERGALIPLGPDGGSNRILYSLHRDAKEQAGC